MVASRLTVIHQAGTVVKRQAGVYKQEGAVILPLSSAWGGLSWNLEP